MIIKIKAEEDCEPVNWEWYVQFKEKFEEEMGEFLKQQAIKHAKSKLDAMVFHINT